MNHDEEPNRESDADREDRLLHRALERTASADDWAAIEAIAERDAGIYQRLAYFLRDDAALAIHLRDPLAAVESIELPAAATTEAARGSSRTLHRAGWLAAAAMFLLWVAAALRLASVDSIRAPVADPSPMESSRPSSFSSQNPDSLVRVSLDGTTTASELSRTLVDAQRADEGWELLYLCRSFERVRVSELHDIDLDDAGSPRIVPVSLSDPSDWREF